jgi:hypothetical protein
MKSGLSASIVRVPRIKRPFPGDLRGVQPLVRREMFDLTEAVIVKHDKPSQRRANTALMSTGSSSSAIGTAFLGAPVGAVSRAKTW